MSYCSGFDCRLMVGPPHIFQREECSRVLTHLLTAELELGVE